MHRIAGGELQPVEDALHVRRHRADIASLDIGVDVGHAADIDVVRLHHRLAGAHGRQVPQRDRRALALIGDRDVLEGLARVDVFLPVGRPDEVVIAVGRVNPEGGQEGGAGVEGGDDILDHRLLRQSDGGDAVAVHV